MNRELLVSIADTISDYRSGEIPAPTPEHVERWVRQFPVGAQGPILEEMDHILKRTYFSEKRIRQFLDGLAHNEKLAGNSPREFWERVSPLRIQVRGTSQGDMTTKLSQVVHERYGVHIGGVGRRRPGPISISMTFCSPAIQRCTIWALGSAPCQMRKPFCTWCSWPFMAMPNIALTRP